MPKYQIAGAVVAFLVATLFSISASALSVLPLELDDIIDQSTVAFEGTCVANRSEIEPGSRLIVTYATFAVKAMLKGTVPASYTVKQVGGAPISGGLLLPSATAYEVGQSYVLFMTGASKAGFSSPVGVGQGKFDIQEFDGTKRATNGRVLRVSPGDAAKSADGAALEPRVQFEVDYLKARVKSRLATTGLAK